MALPQSIQLFDRMCPALRKMDIGDDIRRQFVEILRITMNLLSVVTGKEDVNVEVFKKSCGEQYCCNPACEACNAFYVRTGRFDFVANRMALCITFPALAGFKGIDAVQEGIKFLFKMYPEAISNPGYLLRVLTGLRFNLETALNGERSGIDEIFGIRSPKCCEAQEQGGELEFLDKMNYSPGMFLLGSNQKSRCIQLEPAAAKAGDTATATLDFVQAAAAHNLGVSTNSDYSKVFNMQGTGAQETRDVAKLFKEGSFWANAKFTWGNDMTILTSGLVNYTNLPLLVPGQFEKTMDDLMHSEQNQMFDCNQMKIMNPQNFAKDNGVEFRFMEAVENLKDMDSMEKFLPFRIGDFSMEFDKSPYLIQEFYPFFGVKAYARYFLLFTKMKTETLQDKLCTFVVAVQNQDDIENFEDANIPHFIDTSTGKLSGNYRAYYVRDNESADKSLASKKNVSTKKVKGKDHNLRNSMTLSRYQEGKAMPVLLCMKL